MKIYPILVALFRSAPSISVLLAWTAISSNAQTNNGGAIEIDVFSNSLAQITLALPNGQTEIVSLSGPTTIAVDIGPKGETTLTDRLGRDVVTTRMTQLDLRGTSSLGPVRVSLDPSQPTLGQIIEQANNTKGILDVRGAYTYTCANTAHSASDPAARGNPRCLANRRE